VIEPIVPQNFEFIDKDTKYGAGPSGVGSSGNPNNNNSTEYMSDLSSDSSSDSEKI
jgi:hypothetical protein